jgi:hypothetical protein
LTSGGITINLCIANLSGFDNAELSYTNGGYQLNNSSIGSWQANTTYHIVARYKESLSNYRQLNYTTIDGTNISTTSEPTRVTTDYAFFALRKTGSIIDYTTNDDVKLGEVTTDSSGNISSIDINGFNRSGDAFTEYLTLPGYRFVENIDAINTEVKNIVCDYSSNMELLTDDNGNPIEVTLPLLTYYTDNGNYRNISNWLWQRTDNENQFSFDSEAEREWCAILLDLINEDAPIGNGRIIKAITVQEEDEDVETIGGLVQKLLCRLAKINDEVQIENLKLRVVELKNRRIKKVLVEKL